MIAGPVDGSSTLTRRRLAVAAAVAAAVLTACSRGGHGSSPPGGTGPGAGAFDSHRSAPAAPITGAVRGGTVTVLTEEDLGHSGSAPDTMDPTGSYVNSGMSILSGLVTRSLTQYVYDPDSGSMVLVPDIATDLGTPNADFTEWTFTIREGVRFEDGTQVHADDIAYGIKRSFDRTRFGGGPSYSNDYFLDGHGYKGPYTSGEAYRGVVVDGNTVTIKMVRPFPDMPYYAAFPAIGPIPEIGSDPATYWRHPMATGPYKFEKYVPKRSLTLVRNDQWDATTDPGRHDYPARYVFKFHRHPGRSEATILGNSIQGRAALSYDGISTATISRAQRRHRLTSGSGNCTSMMWPDNRKITDIRVREALGYAYPYRQVTALNGGAVGVTSLPGTSLLPLGTPGRQDYTVLDAEPGETHPHKARMLLRRAGYGPGDFPITFAYSDAADSPFGAAVKDQLVKSLHAAGFATHPIRATTATDYFAVEYDRHAPINVRFDGLCSDWPSGSYWVPQFFASDGGFNDAYFAEPSVDASIDRISSLPLDEQPSAWGSLDKEVMTRYYPGVILSYNKVQMLHGASIGGMNDDPQYGMPTWKDIYVGH